MTLASADHTVADRRTAEILASAKQAFAEKGFDGASMQDLARAAGMSVGNFYRYFASKDAIVEAITAQDITEISGKFEAIVTAADPLAALRATMREHLGEGVCRGDGALWAEIQAASRRKPEIARISRQIEDRIVDYLMQVFRLVAGPGVSFDPAEARNCATVMVLLVKTVAMQAPRDNHADLSACAMRIMDRMLCDLLQRPLP